MPRPIRHNPSRRGQTLVLFALTLVLLALMVMMTLSIGSKVIEKNDLNHVAETAAYNQAVVVARTFNAVSLINRTQISHMVALAGVQSLISWTGAYRGSIALLAGGFDKSKKPKKNTCDEAVGATATLKQRQKSKHCGCVHQAEIEAVIEAPLIKEEKRIKANWAVLDAAAGAQARAIRDEAELMYAEQVALYRDGMLSEIANQRLTSDLVAAALVGQRVPAELTAPRAGGAVATRELGGSASCIGSTGSGCMPNGPNAHMVWAAMGTRGFGFTTSRSGETGALTTSPFLMRMAMFLPASVSMSLSVTGSGYFANQQLHGIATTTNQMAWADDHIGFSANYDLAKGTVCGTRGQFTSNGDAWVKSSEAGDEHVWPGITTDALGLNVPFGDGNPALRHTVAVMWPRFIDYNADAVAKAEDAFGQPKTYAVVGRDYSVRTQNQPWDRNLRFGFTTRGGQLDMRPGSAGVGTALQTSLAQGIAYYHRPGHWKEPPNFMNPFWRGTVMAPDLLDRESIADVPQVLNEAGAGDAARVFSALYQAGYRGF